MTQLALLSYFSEFMTFAVLKYVHGEHLDGPGSVAPLVVTGLVMGLIVANSYKTKKD